MTVNFNGVIRIMEILLIVLGVCMIPSLLVAVIYSEDISIRCFSLTLIPCLGVGILMTRIFRPSLIKLKARDGFLIVSLSWIISSLIGAVPLTMSGAIPSYVDSFFEVCSGFSTTGSTILSDVESLPKSMLFWRSFTHWLGGMGIIVFAMAFMPSIGVSGQLIASAETPGPTLDKVSPKFSDTARSLYLVYIFFTMLETILLTAGGMSLYDALIQTFGTVGTGGFSNYGNSIAHFTSPYIQWVIIIFMVMCGVNFNLYFTLAKHGPMAMLKDPELRFYLFIIGIAGALITLNLLISGGYASISKGVRDSFFQVTSIITTTGYATADYELWPTFSKMVLFLLMLIGACSSSTGGGVKVIRILISFKLIRRGVSLKLHPNRVTSLTLNGREVPQDIASNIANFVFLYILVIFTGTLIVSFNGYDIITTLSAVVTCVGNVGPGFQKVGPVENFGFFSDFSKLVLSFLMIAGRLELFTFFMLFSPRYWNSNRA